MEVSLADGTGLRQTGPSPSPPGPQGLQLSPGGSGCAITVASLHPRILAESWRPRGFPEHGCVEGMACVAPVGQAVPRALGAKPPSSWKSWASCFQI